MTYTSPDGAFQFQYPAQLVLCRRDRGSDDIWSPLNVCSSYIPLCSASTRNRSGIVVCLGYPAGTKEEATTFEGAAFSVVELGQLEDENVCYRVSQPPPAAAEWQTKKINGLLFHTIRTDGVATGHHADGYVYRVFHEGNCYELNIEITSFSRTLTDPPTKGFDPAPVRKALTVPVNTFKFLK